MLTFIGSGYGIINGVVTYFKADTFANVFVNVKTKMNEDLSKKKKAGKDDNLARKIMNTASEISSPESLRKTAIGSCITGALCILGAVLMWYLRRAGFYIYVLGTIIGVVLPFYFFGSNLLTNLSVGFTGLIGLLFIIFYAMNIKSMK